MWQVFIRTTRTVSLNGCAVHSLVASFETKEEADYAVSVVNAHRYSTDASTEAVPLYPGYE